MKNAMPRTKPDESASGFSLSPSANSPVNPASVPLPASENGAAKTSRHRKRDRLWEKTVIVTGASSGIGRSLCKRLVERHACRVIGVARNEERCLSLREELGDAFSYHLFDVSDEKAWQAFAARLQEENILPDILVNNAGMLPRFCRFDRMDAALFSQTIDVDFLSVVYACRAMLPLLLRAPSPMLCNIASSAALCPLPGVTPYAAAKAAVKSFTESLAAEYAPDRLRVCLILPGFTLTDIFREQKESGMRNPWLSRIAMPCKKMAGKIERALQKGKPRKVFGADAKGMDLLYKLFPAHAARLCGNVLRLGAAALFEDVFPTDGI